MYSSGASKLNEGSLSSHKERNFDSDALKKDTVLRWCFAAVDTVGLATDQNAATSQPDKSRRNNVRVIVCNLGSCLASLQVLLLQIRRPRFTTLAPPTPHASDDELHEGASLEAIVQIVRAKQKHLLQHK